MSIIRHPIYILPWLDYKFNFESIKTAFRDVVNNIEQEKTVYVHCIQGSDRTGILVTALLVRDNFCKNREIETEKLSQMIRDSLDKHKFHKTLFPFVAVLNEPQL